MIRRAEGSLVGVTTMLLLGACTTASQDAPGPPSPSETSASSEGAEPQADETSPRGGRELEVAPDGDDDATGDSGDPFETIGHALGELRPGDKLVVRGGEYREAIDLDVMPGTEEAPITVTAASGEEPVVRGLLWLENLSWWRISGVDVTWDTKHDDDEHMVKLADGNDWVFSDAELSSARSYAALLVSGRPERFLLTGLYVHDTKDTNGENQDHLVYLNCGTGGGVLERSLLVDSPNGRAVKIGPAGSDEGPVGNIVVRYNTMVDNEGPSNVQVSLETSDVVIERNIMDGSGEDRPSVTAFDLGGEGNVVRDNLTWRSAGTVQLGEPGLQDTGGNVEMDPRLAGASDDRPYEPRAEGAQAYGRWAPEQG